MDTNSHESSTQFCIHQDLRRCQGTFEIVMVFTNLRKSVNGADGISDIEGKVARVSDKGDGKRPSFRICGENASGKFETVLAAVSNRLRPMFPERAQIDL